jgi:dolichol-phosphate mannosyltransferase
MGSPLELCLAIPTLNETGNIGPLLTRLDEALTGIAWEAIFVDDDSRDGTAALIRALQEKRPNVRVLQRIGRRGLWSECMEGMMATAAPYIAVMDADMQHDERILPEMPRRAREEQYDLAIGSRNLDAGGMGEFPRKRVLRSEAGKRLSQLVCRIPVTDPMSGYFLVEREFAHRAIRRMSGYSYEVLLDMISASPAAPRWMEVGYIFRARVSGESKLNLNTLLEFGLLVIHKAIRGVVPVRFVLFCLVGATGVAVHLAALAMTSNFWLNNQFTFRVRRLRRWELVLGGGYRNRGGGGVDLWGDAGADVAGAKIATLPLRRLPRPRPFWGRRAPPGQTGGRVG